RSLHHIRHACHLPRADDVRAWTACIRAGKSTFADVLCQPRHQDPVLYRADLYSHQSCAQPCPYRPAQACRHGGRNYRRWLAERIPDVAYLEEAQPVYRRCVAAKEATTHPDRLPADGVGIDRIAMVGAGLVAAELCAKCAPAVRHMPCW